MGFDISAEQFVNGIEVNGHKNLSVPRILKDEPRKLKF